jgi:hypothetical protein
VSTAELVCKLGESWYLVAAGSVPPGRKEQLQHAFHFRLREPPAAETWEWGRTVWRHIRATSVRVPMGVAGRGGHNPRAHPGDMARSASLLHPVSGLQDSVNRAPGNLESGPGRSDGLPTPAQVARSGSVTLTSLIALQYQLIGWVDGEAGAGLHSRRAPVRRGSPSVRSQNRSRCLECGGCGRCR